MGGKKFLAVLAAMGLAFLAIAGGGCGGSSSSGGGANSAFNGVWRATSGAAKLALSGTTLDLDVSQLYFMGANSDVEKETGTMTATMMILLSSAQGQFPMIYDGVTLTMTRVDADEWDATAATSLGNAAFNVTLDSATEATLTSGTFTRTGDFTVTLSDIELTKLTDTGATLAVDSVLEGAWLNSAGTGGGFVDVNNEGTHSYFITPVSSPYSVSAGLSVTGASISQGTAAVKGGLSLNTVNPRTNVSTTFPFVFDTVAENLTVRLAHLFGDVYRVTLGESVKGYMMFQSATQANFLVNIMLAPTGSSSSWVMLSAVAPLTKSSAGSAGDASLLLIGKTYETRDCAGFGGVTGTGFEVGTGLNTILDGGTLAIKNAGSGQITLDISLVINRAASKSGATGTFPFERSVVLTLQSLGGNMYLATGSSDEMYGLILLIPSKADLSEAFGVLNLQDKVEHTQLNIAGRLVQRQ